MLTVHKDKVYSHTYKFGKLTLLSMMGGAAATPETIPTGEDDSPTTQCITALSKMTKVHSQLLFTVWNICALPMLYYVRDARLTSHIAVSFLARSCSSGCSVAPACFIEMYHLHTFCIIHI